jgi:TIR domain
MNEPRDFNGFFSYSHQDAETDPQLTDAFTTMLEKRVTAKLTGARFKIWRDIAELRTGDKWNPAIEAQLQKTHVLIILLTPRWIDSDYCLKEYSIFESIEASRGVGEYVAPILVRTLERQEKYFSSDQRRVYGRLKERQYTAAIATEFIRLSEADRIALVDKTADDIEGMLDRLRAIENKPDLYTSNSRAAIGAKKINPYNFEEHDFVSNFEVAISANAPHNIFGQIGFLERVYVNSPSGHRIEFGVQRAIMSIDNNGPGELAKTDHLRRGYESHNVRYVLAQGNLATLRISIDPISGQSTLGEHALPPGPNDNYWCHVATASPEISTAQLKAHVSVSLSPEGLYISGEDDHAMTQQTKGHIAAILAVAIRKNAQVTSSHNYVRSTTVRVRD